MNKNNLKILAAMSVALVLILAALQFSKDDSASSGSLLFPQLKSEINDITSLTITRAGDENATVIRKESDNWIIASRDNYPADIAKLRTLLLALADAKMIEQKTSDPERYGQLGVADPGIESSKGTRLELAGGDVAYSLVIGNMAQTGYRYVRISEDPQSWLIDKNPDLPGSPGEWLRKDIIDIKATDIQSVTISHPDDEEIRISKESAEETDFAVADIPNGRELSYATVANGIAGVLNSLSLDDVRNDTAMSADSVRTTFDTFDGVRIVIRTEQADDESWITLKASAVDAEVSSVEIINARVEGWQFKIAEYKANQLTRRWEDILKAEAE
jgi:hypothetical protein